MLVLIGEMLNGVEHNDIGHPLSHCSHCDAIDMVAAVGKIFSMTENTFMMR